MITIIFIVFPIIINITIIIITNNIAWRKKFRT